MNDYAIDLILNYISGCLPDPKLNWPKDEFDKRLYSKWAAYEILTAIMEGPMEPAQLTVYGFKSKMECYFYMPEDDKKRNIFLAAKETAEDILYLLERRPNAKK